MCQRSAVVADWWRDRGGRRKLSRRLWSDSAWWIAIMWLHGGRHVQEPGLGAGRRPTPGAEIWKKWDAPGVREQVTIKL
jgi:hypothetical protein